MKKKEKSGKVGRERGARTEKERVMSTEMPLLGFLAEIKNTQKHVYTYINTRYITLLEVYEGSEKQG